MMTDPREDKLPKWAQDIIRAERIRAALAWPTEPEPEPAFHFDSNGRPLDKRRPEENETVYKHNKSGHVFSYTYQRSGMYLGNNTSTFGSRPEGRYYPTHDDALLACRWSMARRFAEQLYEAGNR